MSAVIRPIPPNPRAALDAFDGGDSGHTLDQAAQAAARVAAQFADAVDRDARFPAEALEAMREQRLLGATVPRELGGSGATLAAVASACRILGKACSAAGMVFAMHHIKVASTIAHASAAPWHRAFLEQLARNQWLVASATSEDGTGGNLRKSQCAVEVSGGRFTLRKLAPTISYGAHADVIIATARRDSSAPASEQVLVTLRKEDLALTVRGGWDTLGMRGTCTDSFILDGQGAIEQIFPVPFADIAETSMVPDSHILWSSLWVGIASDAYARAQRYFREQSPNGDSPAGRRIAEALSLLQAMQARIDSALHRRANAHPQRSWSECMADAAQINALKTFVSNSALGVAEHAMMAIGMAAYKNGTPFSLGRHLRDLHAAPLMINNDRIEINTARLILAQRPDHEVSAR
ncbi:MAG: acyl-CoA/acyl-ACP dehydrogenase [Paraburkholderia sp.]|jgi:acyl-CoA dehydrogenase|nr:acyl-CoA/acyl-ACP dehydrogenase [Paraburkholderia sp.]